MRLRDKSKREMADHRIPYNDGSGVGTVTSNVRGIRVLWDGATKPEKWHRGHLEKVEAQS